MGAERAPSHARARLRRARALARNPVDEQHRAVDPGHSGFRAWRHVRPSNDPLAITDARSPGAVLQPRL